MIYDESRIVFNSPEGELVYSWHVPIEETLAFNQKHILAGVGRSYCIDLASLFKLFTSTIDSMPFAGKIITSPMLKSAFREKDPFVKEVLLSQSLICLLFLSACHGLVGGANLGILVFTDANEHLFSSALLTISAVMNAAVAVRQLELSLKVEKKRRVNSRRIQQLLDKDDESLSKMLIDYALGGEVYILDYLLVLAGKQRLSAAARKAMLQLSQSDLANTSLHPMADLTSFQQQVLRQSLQLMTQRLNAEHRGRFELMARNLLNTENLENDFTIKEVLTMVVLTGAAQILPTIQLFID